MNKTDICSICLENLNDQIITTSCKHCFHKNCFNKIHGYKCPLCREDISNVLRHEVLDELFEAWGINILNTSNEIERDNNGKLYTSVPVDIFNIINITTTLRDTNAFKSVLYTLSVLLDKITLNSINKDIDVLCSNLNNINLLTYMINEFEDNNTFVNFEDEWNEIKEKNLVSKNKFTELIINIMNGDILGEEDETIIATYNDYLFDLKNWLFEDNYNLLVQNIKHNLINNEYVMNMIDL